MSNRAKKYEILESWGKAVRARENWVLSSEDSINDMPPLISVYELVNLLEQVDLDPVSGHTTEAHTIKRVK